MELNVDLFIFLVEDFSQKMPFSLVQSAIGRTIDRFPTALFHLKINDISRPRIAVIITTSLVQISPSNLPPLIVVHAHQTLLASLQHLSQSLDLVIVTFVQLFAILFNSFLQTMELFLENEFELFTTL